MIEEYFEDAKTSFHLCLIANEDEEHLSALENLRFSLINMEKFNPSVLGVCVRKNIELFIQIFQFESLSGDGVWAKIPNLYSLIGEFIQIGPEHERTFRSRVVEQNLGRFMKFTY